MDLRRTLSEEQAPVFRCQLTTVTVLQKTKKYIATVFPFLPSSDLFFFMKDTQRGIYLRRRRCGIIPSHKEQESRKAREAKQTPKWGTEQRETLLRANQKTKNKIRKMSDFWKSVLLAWQNRQSQKKVAKMEVSRWTCYWRRLMIWVQVWVPGSWWIRILARFGRVELHSRLGGRGVGEEVDWCDWPEPSTCDSGELCRIWLQTRNMYTVWGHIWTFRICGPRYNSVWIEGLGFDGFDRRSFETPNWNVSRPTNILSAWNSPMWPNTLRVIKYVAKLWRWSRQTLVRDSSWSNQLNFSSPDSNGTWPTRVKRWIKGQKLS